LMSRVGWLCLGCSSITGHGTRAGPAGRAQVHTSSARTPQEGVLAGTNEIPSIARNGWLRRPRRNIRVKDDVAHRPSAPAQPAVGQLFHSRGHITRIEVTVFVTRSSTRSWR
jgi:hypothetical protein